MGVPTGVGPEVGAMEIAGIIVCHGPIPEGDAVGTDVEADAVFERGVGVKTVLTNATDGAGVFFPVYGAGVARSTYISTCARVQIDKYFEMTRTRKYFRIR